MITLISDTISNNNLDQELTTIPDSNNLSDHHNDISISDCHDVTSIQDQYECVNVSDYNDCIKIPDNNDRIGILKLYYNNLND